VVSRKNYTIAAPDAPTPSPRRLHLATERFWLLHRLREHLPMPASDPLTPRSCRVPFGFLVSSQPFREKAPNFPPMPPHQPLRVQHARPILVGVPRRPEPPVHLSGPLQP